jgi:Rad3-related DNA helicase
VLLEECKPPVGPDTEAWQAASALNQAALELNRTLEDIAEELDGLEERSPSAPERAGDVRAQARRLDEATNDVAFLLGQEEPGFVYWLERTQRGNRTYASVHGAPLEVSSEMRNHYLTEKRTVLFTSATMKVGGSFDYMRDRLGAGDIDPGRFECQELGSSFDYDSQTLVGAATFLPDPGGRRDELYDEELASFLIDLLRVTQGRALVLCTAYSLVNSLHDRIKTPLESAGSMVLAQGRDGSREAITEMFRNSTSSVLLGTQSFWEGVDIAGETLSCLILTKLPFHPINDPLVRGRTEHLRQQGRDPFQQYTLPEAIISFRQGFGRLIRHRTDRGVIIVTDRRLATKGYGREFLRDLPTQANFYENRDPLIREVENFLT